MASAAAVALPEGWTEHELNGSRFYFHRSSNTIQTEPPATTADSMAAAPSAPPAPLATGPAFGHTESPEQSETMWKAPAASPWQLDQAMQHIASAPPMPNAPPPTPGAMPGPTIVSVSPPPNAPPVTWHKLNVLVPAPGLHAGQELAFETPATNGLQSQSLSVKVQEAVVAGSMITVRYPGLPAPSSDAQARPSLPMPSVDMTLQEDRRATATGWGLYMVGWTCMFFCPPAGFAFWCAAAASYFCKPRAVRARRQQQRKPAYVSCLTLLAAALVACLAGLFLLTSGSVHYQAGHHHEWHHHGHHHAEPLLKSVRFKSLRGHQQDRIPSWTTSVVA